MNIWREIRREFRNLPFTISFVLVPVWKSRRSRWGLRCESGAFRKLRANDLVAVLPSYGADALLSACLDHHRRLGVDLFVLLDLSEGGGLGALLKDTPDCIVWRPRRMAKLKRALFWLNYLRRRYATGRWCLSIEPSELIVFHHSETRKLKDLIEFVDSERLDHVCAVVVEMYADRPAEELTMEAGKNPRDLLPLFDPLGYETPKPGRLREVQVRGGPQRRLLFPSIPRRAPSLARVPLVKWRWYYGYGAGTRVMVPRNLNRPHSKWHSSATVCLLSFAQLCEHAVLTRAAEAESGETVSGSGDPIYPGTLLLRRLSPKTDNSALFTSSADLAKAGLFSPGQWF